VENVKRDHHDGIRSLTHASGPSVVGVAILRSIAEAHGPTQAGTEPRLGWPAFSLFPSNDRAAVPAGDQRASTGDGRLSGRLLSRELILEFVNTQFLDP
jgi:hypothetical protein